jgi:hypothetical protein
MTEIYNYQNKYNYKLNESEPALFVFEIIFSDLTDNNRILRKVKKTTKGEIISLLDNIIYDNIKQMTFTIIDINRPTEELIIELIIDHDNKYCTFINSSISLEIYKNNKYLKCNYILYK